MTQILNFLRRRANEKDAVHKLYGAIVAHARTPDFYTRYGVPDTLEGRFDMISLVAFVVLRRLRKEGKDGARYGQKLFDLMFADMDRNLREMGLGDLRVGTKVKELATLFYGRIAAYEDGLERGEAELVSALARNLYCSESTDPTVLAAMAAHLKDEVVNAESWITERLMAGTADFVAPDSQKLPGTQLSS